MEDALLTHGGTLHRLAWHRLRYNRAEEAEPLYRLLSLLAPSDFTPLAGLVYALLLQGRSEEAAPLLARLRALAATEEEQAATSRLERRRAFLGARSGPCHAARRRGRRGGRGGFSCG